MDALILAAGQGSRLGHDRPKCLIELGGRHLVDRQIEALRWAGVDRITVVAGFRAGVVCQTLPSDTAVVHNPRYDETNSMYSFWLARDAVGDEVVVLNADVLFHPLIARALVRSRGSALAYDSTSGAEDEHMKVTVRRGRLVTMSKSLHPRCTSGENVGMIRLSGAATAAAFDAAERLVAGGRERSWLGAAISDIALEHELRCLDVAGLPWAEIDFPEDLEHAREHVLPALGTLPTPAWSLAPAA